LFLASDQQWVSQFFSSCALGFTRSSCLQDVLLCNLCRKHQLPRRIRYSLIRLLGCFLAMRHSPMQVSASISFDLRQSVVRHRQF
jgi:hypothetical protein